MRRVLAITLPLLVVLAACGDASTDGGSDTTAGSDGSVASTTPAVKPEVSLPASLPTELVVTDLTVGTGPEAKEGDVIILDYVGVRSKDGVEFDNSYDRGEPLQLTLGGGQVIQGWEQGLVGVQAGGQRQLDIPSALAYGDQDKSDIITANTDLSFVVDVVAVLPITDVADQPQIELEPADNIDTIESTDLIVGTGATPADGDSYAVQLVLYSAATGEQLNTTWGTPTLVFQYGPESDTFPGINDMVTGMKVGGRRQAQVPYASMFDGQGNATLGLAPATDLVMVMDLVAVY
jgi:peptidylprolyl isomerase